MPPHQRARIDAGLAVVVIVLAAANLLWPDGMGPWGSRLFICAYFLFFAWDLLDLWAKGALHTPLSELPTLARKEGARPLSAVAAIFGAFAIVLLL